MIPSLFYRMVPCLILAGLMLLLTTFETALFPLLSLYADRVQEGEIWRLVTANLVHFGWIHTLMNLAALILCVLAFFSDMPPTRWLALVLWCCLGVGLGIAVWHPEYAPYAGFSGALHGLVVAGLLQTKGFPAWLRLGALILVAAKLLHEHSPDYEATDLQQLIPAAVAVESHAYGALAGAIFVALEVLWRYLKRNM